MICANYKDLIIPDTLKTPNLEKALAWLKADSWKDIPLGKTEIYGENIYVMRSLYMSKTRNETRYESHRRYLDIQMLIKGSEVILSCLRDGLKVAISYSEEKDIDFLEGEPDIFHSVILNFPLAVLYFPWDVHMPCIAINDIPSEVEKIVVKVAM